MNPRVTVGLLIVFVALGAYYFYGAPPSAPATPPGMPTPKPVDPSLELWTVQESEIQAVTVRRDGQEAGVQRSGEEWQLVPSNEPADRLRVNSLMFRLASVKATYRVPNPTGDAEYGLAPPATVATIRLASGQSYTLSLGSKAPAESGTYARKDAEPAIYLVSNALADDLAKLVTEPPRPPSPTPLPSPAASPSPAP